MKDGSGNPPDFSSGDCSVQPDAAATQCRLGHAQKKSLMKIQQGLIYLCFEENYSVSSSSLSSFSTASL
jgi:hypothetical protein